jgi:signal transduction histidine kinase
LQTITTDADLVVFMTEGLKFLELKHQARISFIKSIDDATTSDDPASAAVAMAHAKKLSFGVLHPGAPLGIDGHVLLFEVQVEGSEQKICGGFVVEHAQAGGALLQALQGDLTLFMQNWTIAHGALLLQQRVAREKLLNERMYIERIESIATMVTGVAHEINTPLGVANTANGMVVSLANEIRETPPGPELDAMIADLKEASGLLSKNLDRASRLVRSFKQLSAGQLSDERTTTDVGSVIRDCLEAMSVETKKRNMPFELAVPEDAHFPWVGFPGHLSQVIMNLIQNALRYAYKPDAPGRVEIRISDTGDNYRIEFEDFGAGVPPEILPRIFEPFVTSGREFGGTGLGLAISQNIMTNLLKGQISCTTEVGKGTKFVLVVPHVVPNAKSEGPAG